MVNFINLNDKINDQTLLILAFEHCNWDICHYLLLGNFGLDVSLTDDLCRTTLHYAIESSRNDGRKALHNACVVENITMVTRI